MNDVRQWLRENLPNVYEAAPDLGAVAGTWQVKPKAPKTMWSETCLQQFGRLLSETWCDPTLLESIKTNGINEPIIIDGTETGRTRKFEIIDGYHRLIAAAISGRKVPVCLIDLSAKGKRPSKKLVKDFLETVYQKERTE